MLYIAIFPICWFAYPIYSYSICYGHFIHEASSLWHLTHFLEIYTLAKYSATVCNLCLHEFLAVFSLSVLRRIRKTGFRKQRKGTDLCFSIQYRLYPNLLVHYVQIVVVWGLLLAPWPQGGSPSTYVSYHAQLCRHVKMQLGFNVTF